MRYWFEQYYNHGSILIYDAQVSHKYAIATVYDVDLAERIVQSLNAEPIVAKTNEPT